MHPASNFIMETENKFVLNSFCADSIQNSNLEDVHTFYKSEFTFIVEKRIWSNFRLIIL